MENLQAEIYKNMPATKKWEIMENMFFTARKMKEAYFKTEYPELSDLEINKKVKEVILYAKDW